MVAYPVSKIVCLAICATVAIARPSNEVEQTENLSEKEKEKLWKEHFNRSLHFKCEPRRQAINSIDLLAENNMHVSTHEYILPCSTVLNVCNEKSGCCPSMNQRCATQEHEPIILVFKIVDKIHKNVTFAKIETYNATKCRCQSDSQPKRLSEESVISPPFASASSTNNFYFIHLLACIVSIYYL